MITNNCFIKVNVWKNDIFTDTSFLLIILKLIPSKYHALEAPKSQKPKNFNSKSRKCFPT